MRFSETAWIENHSIEVYYLASNPNGSVGAITIEGGDRSKGLYAADLDK